ncbi:hypothetical protein [Candidatus Marithrix sp. Canyon 246]|uniref:hypothetical protein n=1 Tax=Candidatus Marithrix sp. Canyon 246 TaxID=1827136 RepID=UPI00084A27D3|nr:hypothetical protein [Candidatus Marithrix sp. Canyon 246]
MDELVKQYDKLRVIHLATNQGKAMGLCMATLASSCEYLSVGAGSGNPRIRNRSSILGKLQVGFRKVALQRIGYWQLHYEPRALCWILISWEIVGE